MWFDQKAIPTLNREGVAAMSLIALTAILVSYALTGFPMATDYSRVWDDGVRPDVIHEVVTAREAISGDAHRQLDEVMSEHGLPANGYEGVSPRPPGALLLQLPLLLIPMEQIALYSTSIIVLLLIAIVYLSGRIAGLSLRQVGWASPLLFLSLPVVTAVSYGSVSALAVVTLLLLAWRLPSSWISGAAIGLAAVWRLWPALLVPLLWISGRRRTALLSAAVFTLVNIGGLLLPGVSLGGSLQSLVEGGSDWINNNLNSSLTLALYPFGVPAILVTVLVSVCALFLIRRYRTGTFEIGILCAVIASPLAWPSYGLAALPVAFQWLARGKVMLVGIASSPVLLWFLVPSKWRGHGMLVVLIAGLLAVVRRHERTQDHKSTTLRLGHPDPCREQARAHLP